MGTTLSRLRCSLVGLVAEVDLAPPRSTQAVFSDAFDEAAVENLQTHRSLLPLHVSHAYAKPYRQMELIENPDPVDRDQPMKSVTARKFRCLDPIANESAAIEILFKRNQLWNQYVESFQRHQAEAEALKQGENTHYAQLSARYAEAGERYAVLISQKKATKSRESHTTPDERAAIDAGIAIVRAEKLAIAGQLKSARAEARVASKATTDAVWTRCKAEQKRLGNASGLWWGNRETVKEAFRAH